MKNAILVCLVGAAAMPALAQNAIKTCSTTISNPEGTEKVPTKFEVFKNQDAYFAKITQVVSGQSAAYDDSAEISEYQVREGLTSANDPDGLNLAEQLIAHAMTLEEDPVFQGIFKSGIHLKDVKSAKVYLIGKMGRMGGTAIIEAKNANGADLGSFLGGFLVFPCAK